MAPSHQQTLRSLAVLTAVVGVLRVQHATAALSGFAAPSMIIAVIQQRIADLDANLNLGPALYLSAPKFRRHQLQAATAAVAVQ
jgi:hypothetical protein